MFSIRGGEELTKKLMSFELRVNHYPALTLKFF